MIFWAIGACFILWILKEVLYRTWPRIIRVPYEIRISSLNVYPVKGLRGHSVNKTELSCTGLLHDRRFVIASIPSSHDGRNGITCRFESQRTYPLMTTITPYILAQKAYDHVQEIIRNSQNKNSFASEFQRLFSTQFPPVPLSSLPEDEPVAILLTCHRQSNPRMNNNCDITDWVLCALPSSHVVKKGLARPVRVWDDLIPGAIDVGNSVSDWLSSALGPSNAELESEEMLSDGEHELKPSVLRLLWQDPAFPSSVRKNTMVPRYTPFFWLHPNAKNLKRPPHPPREYFPSKYDAALAQLSYYLCSGLPYILPYLIPYPLHIRLWKLAVDVDPRVSFADGSPLLLASEESLQALNAAAMSRASDRVLSSFLKKQAIERGPIGDPNAGKQKEAILGSDEFCVALQAELTRVNFPFPMQRFRPNIVVSQSPVPKPTSARTSDPSTSPQVPSPSSALHHAWNEDHWQELRLIGSGTKLLGASRCARCMVTTLHPHTGTRNPPASLERRSACADVPTPDNGREEEPEEDGEDFAVAMEREPLSTLAQTRASYLGPQEGIFFGVDFIPRGLRGIDTVPIEVGETLQLIKTGPIGAF